MSTLLATFRIEADDHLHGMTTGLLALTKATTSEERQPLLEDVFRAAHSLKGAARAIDLMEVEMICQSIEGIFAQLKRGERQLSAEGFDAVHAALDTVTAVLSTPQETHATQVSNAVQWLTTIAQITPQQSATSALSPTPVPAPPPAPRLTPPLAPPGHEIPQTRPPTPAATDFLSTLLATFRVEADDHLRSMATGLLALERATTAAERQPLLENVFREAHSLKGAARAVDFMEVEMVCQSLESIFSQLKHGEQSLSAEGFDAVHAALDTVTAILSVPQDSHATQVSNVMQWLTTIARQSHRGEETPLLILTPRSATHSPTQAAQLQYVLEQHQYTVTIARNGVEALDILAHSRPAVVISDIVMPEMDGYELSRRIRATPQSADVSILLLTSRTDPKDVIRALESRADNFITKPWTEEFLLSRLQYILVNQQLRKNRPTDGSIEIYFSGQKYRFASDPTQMVDLLLSTFDNAIQKNLELERANRAQVRIQLELKKLNEQLEQRVKERTRKLTVSEANFRRLLENNADAIIVVDQTEIVRFANPAAEEILAHSATELLNMTLPFPITVEETKEVAIARTNRDSLIAEMRVVETVWEGEPAFVASLRDITERKRTEEVLHHAKEAAEAADQAKSNFLANMSHEIRTPMNGILGMLGLLLESDLTPEQLEHAETVKQCADSLLTIINEILDFSRVESGALELELVDFDLHEAIDEVVDLFARQAAEKRLELASLIYHDVPTALRGDVSRVRQILSSLMGNALKFTEYGEVVLRVTLQEQVATRTVLRFSVSDTGIGIPPERRDLLFQTFSQIDASSTRKYGGVGLGLAMCKQLAIALGGTIGGDSELGKGSTFWFTVPFEKQASEMLPMQRPRTDLTGLYALVVDDNQTNRTILRHQLSSWGIKPHTAKDAYQALEMMQTAAEEERPYDIAVIDYQMPGMDGIVLANTIRSIPALASSRIVLLTSVGAQGENKRAHEAGVDAYLTKPVHQPNLFACLCKVMGPATGYAERLVPRLVAPPTTDLSPHKRLRVLVAEDNTVNQKLLTRLLEKSGYSAEIAKNGVEALTALSESAYDAVLMDCQMPEMDGFKTTAAIRQHDQEKGTHTLIIAVTAHERPGDRERCLVAGMDDYLTKPIKLKELQETLTRLLPPVTRTITISPARVEKLPLEIQPDSPSTSEAIAVTVPAVPVPVAPQRIPVGTRLLVAEDNPVNQKLIVRLLEKLGIHADVVGNGLEAVEAFSLRTYNAVLMDCQMPEMDGFQATIAIRHQNQREGKHTPIIAVTAHAMKGDRERCLASGMDDYVTKPLRPDTLKKVLEQWLPPLSVQSAGALTLAPAETPFNLQAALERVEGDQELLSEMASLFLTEYPRFLQQLHQAIAENDAETVTYTAHTLKGSVGNFVDEETATAAWVLEKMGREGELARAPFALARLESALARLTPALAKLTTGIAA